MAIITLTTEWREDDIFHGIVRGKLLSACPAAVIVTNASVIPALNIMHGAFVIRNTFSHYPEGTIHMIFINSEATVEHPHLLVKALGHFFIGADNGMFNLILNSQPEKVIRLRNDTDRDDITLFTDTAAALAGGTKPERLGDEVPSFTQRVPLRATIERDVIIGSVIFIDSYGNAVTNITREVFHRVFEERKFRILIKSNKYFTEKISKTYSEEPVGELVSRFNALDLLEISINSANLCQLFGIDTGDAVRVEARRPEITGKGLF